MIIRLYTINIITFKSVCCKIIIYKSVTKLTDILYRYKNMKMKMI